MSRMSATLNFCESERDELPVLDRVDQGVKLGSESRTYYSLLLSRVVLDHVKDAAGVGITVSSDSDDCPAHR